MYPYISIFGLNIGAYGVCMVVGIFLAVFLSMRRAKKLSVSPYDILIVAATAMGIGLLCGGLLYTFVTYPLDVIIAQVKAGNFDIFSGGIVFYGGLIGGIFGGILGMKIAKCNMGSLLRSVVPFIPVGHAIGRLGCLFAGCCHGFEYDGFLAVYYPHSVAGLPADQGYFPVQLLEAVMNLGICGLLLLFDKRAKRNFDMLFAYLACYGVSRFLLEMLRGDSIRGIYFGLSVSQWISIGIWAACALYFLVCRFKEKKKEA